MENQKIHDMPVPRFVEVLTQQPSTPTAWKNRFEELQKDANNRLKQSGPVRDKNGDLIVTYKITDQGRVNKHTLKFTNTGYSFI